MGRFSRKQHLYHLDTEASDNYLISLDKLCELQLSCLAKKHEYKSKITLDQQVDADRRFKSYHKVTFLALVL